MTLLLHRGRLVRLILLLSAFSMSASPLLLGQAQAQSNDSGPLNSAFQRAAQEFDVPRDLLVAIAYAETHLDDHGGKPSIDHGFGLMHLVDNPQVHTLPNAAALLHADPAGLQSDQAQNIRGGAAVLRGLADQQGLTSQSRQNLSAWYPVVSRYSNAADDLVARQYADEVFQLLQSGVQATSPQGESVTVAPQTVTFQAVTAAPTSPTQDLDYPASLWVPASSANYDVANRPVDYPINLIVIHVTEGSYTSAINWFQNPDAQASAHYVIRSSDGQVTQMVHLKDIAWHAGNYDYNTRSIGIEHEGYVEDGGWFTDAMYRASANLVRALCLKYNIPMDRQHIIGHNEVPDPNNPGQFGGVDHHTDPGPYWNWDYYMQLVKTPPTASVAPIAGDTYYSQTGHNVGPTFGAYWNTNGGLPVFGYPHTDPIQEQSAGDGKIYTVQYFERERFEDHPENAGTPYNVLLGLLGTAVAQNQGLTGTPPFQPIQGTSDANCTYFSQTGHRLCNGFRTYWQTHGLDMGDPGISYRESLALFGYPISEEFTDPQTGYTVQYFERARFEYHPEYAGTPYEVELGLLGNEVLQQRGWMP